MKKLSGKGIIILGVVVIAVAITGLILLNQNKKNRELDNTTTAQEVQTTTEKDSEKKEKAFEKTEYSSAITKTFECSEENFGGDLFINAYKDMDLHNDNYKISCILLMSPKGNKFRILTDDKEEKNLIKEVYGYTYRFTNPIEQGEWKVILYGDNITESGTNLIVTLDSVNYQG